MIFRAASLKQVSVKLLPFSDAVSDDLPLGQLLRLSLFQVSVGMAAVMLLGTLNRVMIVELNILLFLRQVEKVFQFSNQLSRIHIRLPNP